MQKKLWFIVALALIPLLSGPVLAQSNVRPIYDDGTGTAAGKARPVDSTHGLPVQIVNPATAPTTAIPVYTPNIKRVTSSQTVTASSIYATGNAVGGKMTFSSAVRASGQGGVVQTAIVRDKAGQNVPYDIILFDADPTSTTVTDKAAVAVNTADLAKVIGVVQTSGIVLGAASTMGIATAAGVGLAFKVTTGTTLYGILVTRGAPTYASTSDVSVDLVIIPD